MEIVEYSFSVTVNIGKIAEKNYLKGKFYIYYTMPCVEICKFGWDNPPPGCRCKQLWMGKRECFLDCFRAEDRHKINMCDCDDAPYCIFFKKNWTSEEERERILESTTEQSFYNYCVEYEDRIEKMKQKAREIVKGKDYYWVRATFSKEQEPEKIDGKIRRLIKLKGLKDIVCNVEFWSDDGKNYNPHSHMIIPKTIKKSKLLKDIARVFEVPENMIEVRIIKENMYSEKYNYIKGLKQTKKSMNVDKDRIERKKYNIPEIYNA